MCKNKEREREREYNTENIANKLIKMENERKGNCMAWINR